MTFNYSIRVIQNQWLFKMCFKRYNWYEWACFVFLTSKFMHSYLQAPSFIFATSHLPPTSFQEWDDVTAHLLEMTSQHNTDWSHYRYLGNRHRGDLKERAVLWLIISLSEDALRVMYCEHMMDFTPGPRSRMGRQEEQRKEREREREIQRKGK